MSNGGRWWVCFFEMDKWTGGGWGFAGPAIATACLAWVVRRFELHCAGPVRMRLCAAGRVSCPSSGWGWLGCTTARGLGTVCVLVVIWGWGWPVQGLWVALGGLDVVSVSMVEWVGGSSPGFLTTRWRRRCPGWFCAL